MAQLGSDTSWVRLSSRMNPRQNCRPSLELCLQLWNQGAGATEGVGAHGGGREQGSRGEWGHGGAGPPEGSRVPRGGRVSPGECGGHAGCERVQGERGLPTVTLSGDWCSRSPQVCTLQGQGSWPLKGSQCRKGVKSKVAVDAWPCWALCPEAPGQEGGASCW